ncbi:uroporphyrinogen-III synthase [Virgibacillus phasianinus]|uniref:Uroporphyrinogen-III synthase n=1 Tax=Virgibacillus phasianinus TaxID=2017483 RepID=A0A220U257_9BACI|nr:uroporphyrinogen-III synthase [Virgibacillus phasianinus]ASK62180.1 uroporphyrinogen-III synthase [Virgibacillus phasianinus]
MIGLKVGIAATRKADEIAALVQKSGGIPVVFSIQGKQQLNESTVGNDIKELLDTTFDVVLLTTGVGIETLESAAHNLGRHSEFIQQLEKTNLAIRGSKTIKWAKKYSLSATYVSRDGTMESLVDALADARPGGGTRLFLQAYNQDDAALQQALEAAGYAVYLSKPYQYKAPDNNTLSALRKEIVDKSLHTVIFTSKTQVHNLFNGTELAGEIVDSFNNGVLAAAVGKITASELEQKGISYVFQPNRSRMGAMVVELREYLATDVVPKT